MRAFLRRLVLVTALRFGSYACDPVPPPVTPEKAPLTPEQIDFLKSAGQVAAVASAKAETDLIAAFRHPSFRLGLLAEGAGVHLADKSAEDILEMVKKAFASLEYTSNFGVSDQYRKTHPGDGAMDLKTITYYGYIPNMWQLNASKSKLVSGIPMSQWQILEAAETGLYGLPSADLFKGLDMTQAGDRPSYLGANTRRVDMGIARYGAYAAILRNDVVRQRTLITATDSGGWENGCNSSVTPVQKFFPLAAKILARCDGMEFEGKYAPGTPESMMHNFLSSTKVFGELGGHLARHVYQLLTPHAKVRPLETLMYPEGGLLGPLRPIDMKLIVADFASLFGTLEAESLRLWCKFHKLPLAWALGFGLSWDDEQNHTKPDFFPWSDTGMMTTTDRLMDPMSWPMTNLESVETASTTWDAVTEDAKLCRKLATPECKMRVQWQNWWQELALATPQAQVKPLYADECNADLCFGSVPDVSKQQCVCRVVPASTQADLVIV